MCGQQVFLDLYMQQLEAGNCTAPTPLYVASGLLTYMNASGATCTPSTDCVPATRCSSGPDPYYRPIRTS